MKAHGAMHLGVALALALTGCRQLVGFADGPSPETQDAGIDAETGVYVSTSGYWKFADPTCGACIDTSCATEAKACAEDPSCQAYEECVAACPAGDRTCAAQCLPRVPSSIDSPQTFSLNHCTAAACKVACPSVVVSLASGQTCGPLFGNADCTSCCCDEFSACDNDPVCVREVACIRRCGQPDPLDPLAQPCFEGCTGPRRGPISPAPANIGLCVSGTRCAGDCFREDWTCLGHVRWPFPSAGSLTLYGTVTDDFPFPTEALQVGFHVKTCALIDYPCAMPLDDAVTDEAGNVELDLSKNAFWTSIYFELTAPAGLDYPTHLFFLPAWTLTHSHRDAFYVYPRTSPASISPSAPGLGGVLFFAHDCSQGLIRAAGVEVTASPAGSSNPARYTMEGLVPNPDATFTDSNGVGLIINLPPGQVMLTATRHETGEHIGTTPIVIRADATTVVDLVPTP